MVSELGFERDLKRGGSKCLKKESIAALYVETCSNKMY